MKGIVIMENAWIIPLFPLLSFFLLLIVGKRMKASSAYVGILATLISFVLALIALVDRFQAPTYKLEGTWLNIGDITLTAGFEVNQLNALMLVIVSLVSFLIHLYSKGYMAGDARMPVFYAYLGLFTFAMLGLVISPNLLQTYVFWELVGLGSFLLIGFYFYKEEAKAAAKKAFIMTRIGDVGLFVGMILLFWQVGSFEFDAIFQAVEEGTISGGWITLTAILIFVGAIGKSGQFPLHTWLPDAMEGPTPVSALIHAATMVAAGVYLVANMFPLFAASHTAMMTVAIIGGFTAIFAASIGLAQKDIKRVLAYSTVSQLGYMMLALGSSAYVAGVFHLMTHAFFKALLFLAAGSVIHAVHTQNIEEMGGLWKKMKYTAPLFLIGTLAISGIPLFSGFFSKEEILLATYADGNYFLFWLGVIAAFFTAFYMFRLFFMVFTGENRGNGANAHESSTWMTLPMLILGVLAVLSGYVNTSWFGPFLGEWLTEGTTSLGHAEVEGPGWIMVVTTIISLLGIWLAYLMYGKRSLARDWLSGSVPGLYKLVYNKYYIDEIYGGSIIYGTRVLGLILAFFDKYIVAGIVSAVAMITRGIGRLGGRIQNGQIQVYGIVIILGLAILAATFVIRGGYLG